MPIILSLLSGLLFGIGLVVSGMSNPAKVLNFLDVAGSWDPSLAVVMAGALSVTMIGYRFTGRWQRPLLAASFDMPMNQQIDARLVIGAILFGAGWGLSGFCPGPAIVALTQMPTVALVFVPTMLLGMCLARRISPTAVSG
jgi:uncharacterized protein